MRKFVVNVNGNSYEVEVEEVGGVTASAPVSAPAAPAAPVAPAAPAAPEKEKPAPAPAQGPAGSVKITAPMPGTILDVKVNPGQQIQQGALLAILEAMKMENEILSPQNATVATVNVSRGQQVNTGDLLFTLN